VSILYAKAGNWWHDKCRRNRPESPHAYAT